jgi:ABC-type antimicrobial peptide transport system permease subunit
VLPDEEVMHRSSVFVSVVSGGSARALGMRVLHGRWISENDPPTNVVVNESLARRDWPGQDAVGRRIRLGSPETRFSTIFGVISDLKYAKLDERPEPEVYVPYWREPPGGVTAIVRTSGDPTTLMAAMRTTLSDVDRAVPAYDMQTLDQALADSIAPRRFNLFLLSVFAAAALGLALIGTYGVTAYAVAQRTHGIGIRMALGADRRDVVSMVVRQGIGLTWVGIVAGVITAALVTRVMASLLYDVRPTDPLTFAIAAVGLTFTA